MPKMKPHSGAKKRFRVTGTGKIMRRRANHNHLLEHKSSTRKRRLYNEVGSRRPTPRRSSSCSACSLIDPHTA